MVSDLRNINPRVLSVIAGARPAPETVLEESLRQLRQLNAVTSAALTDTRRELAEVKAELIRRTASPFLCEVNEQLVLSLIAAKAHADEITRVSAELERLARTDQLTGLANRSCLFDRLAQAICHARRHGEIAALVYLDLNSFKQVNDTFGHAVGDQVLVAAAASLATVVRASDTVCRYGGDEFLVLLSEVRQVSEITLVIEKIEAALALPKQIGKHVFRLSASCGVSIFPDDGNDAETLINCADDAMYRAKRLRSHRRPDYARTSGPQTAQSCSFSSLPS